MGVAVAEERSMSVRLSLIVGDFIQNSRKAGQSIGSIADAAAKPTTAMQGLKDVGADLGRTMAATAGIGATAMAAWTTNAFATGVAYNSLQQRAGSALETLLGSAQAATDQMAELAEFAKTSPFPRQLWIQAQQTLIGFGVEAEKIVPIFQALQDGVVAVGGSAQSIEEVVLILSKISSVGKVTAEDLNELGVRGIDAATLVGEAWGMTAAEVRDSMSQGAVDAAEFMDTLVSQLSAKYQGAAAGLRTTWVGAMDRIAGATRDVGSKLAAPFVDPQGGGAAVEWANAAADAIRAFEDVLGPTVETLSSRAEPAFQAAAEAMANFTETIRGFDLVAFIDQISIGGPALAGFGAAAAAAGSASLLGAVGMGSLAGAINPLVAGLVAAAAASPEVRDALGELVVVVSPLIPQLTDLALQLFGVASSGIGMAGSLLSTAMPVLQLLVTVITPVVQAAAVLAETFDAIPGPALAATAGVLGLVKVITMLKSFTGSLTIAAALDTMVTKASNAAGAVGGLRGALKGLAAAGIVGAVVGLANAFDTTAEQLERVQAVDVSGLAEDLMRLLNTGQASAGLEQLFGAGAESADEFVDKMYVASEAWYDWNHGLNRSLNENAAAEQSFEQLDSAMAQLVGSGENARLVLNSVAEAYDLNEEEVDVLLGLLPKYSAAADRQSEASTDAAGAADEHAEGMEGVEGQAKQTTNALQILNEELRAQTDPVFAAVKATRDLSDAQDAYDDAVAEHGASSEEARDAMLDLLQAQVDVAGAAADLGDVTNGLPPEMLALAEAAGLSADDIAWLEEQLQDTKGTGEELANAMADINADITTSTGRMAAQNALELAGMDSAVATMVVNSKSNIDALMDAGWTYADAIAFVADQSGLSTSEIQEGFEEARDKGLEFSDEYPAFIRLENYEETQEQIRRTRDLLNSVDRTVNISFQYDNFVPRGGINIPVSAEGRIARSPMLTWVAEDGAPESIISWDPKHRDRSLSIWEETGKALGAFTSQTQFAAPAPPTITHAAPMGPRGMHVDNLNVTTVTGAFDTRQFYDALSYEGVS